LQELLLDNNQLTGSIPSQLGNLGNLQSLYLYDKQLTGSIPQSVLDLQANLNLENPPDVKTEISDVSASLGKNFNLDLRENFGDINNNINGYSASGLPPGLTINSEGAISGVPTTKGTFTVTATASDQGGNQAEDTFEIAVGTTVDVYVDFEDYNVDGGRTLSSWHNQLAGETPERSFVLDGSLDFSYTGGRDASGGEIAGTFTNGTPDELTSPNASHSSTFAFRVEGQLQIVNPGVYDFVIMATEAQELTIDGQVERSSSGLWSGGVDRFSHNFAFRGATQFQGSVRECLE